MTHKKKLYGNNGGSSADAGLSFRLPLQTSVQPTFARGSSTATFSRALATKSIVDFEGLYKPILANEVGFSGARRVQNLSISPLTDPITWAVTHTNGTTTGGIDDPFGGTNAWTITATGANADFRTNGSGSSSAGTAVSTLYMRRRTGTGTIQLYGADNSTLVTVTLTSQWKRFSSGALSVAINGRMVGFTIATSGDAIDIAYPQCELVTGQTNQNPSEYVSVGVLSSPYHGAMVDGVKYFSTLNGNTVSSNVVTEATGAAINSSNAKFGVLPGVAGSYFSTPSNANLLLTGDMTIVQEVTNTALPNGASGRLQYKFVGGAAGWAFLLSTGTLSYVSVGTNSINVQSTATLPATILANQKFYVKVICDVDNGSAQSSVTFWYSTDGTNWTQLGTARTTAGVHIRATNSDQVSVGMHGDGTTGPWSGNIYRSRTYSDITETNLVLDFNPNNLAGDGIEGGQWASDATGEIWTINGNAAIFGAKKQSITNLCLQSQTFDNASWTKNNITITADAVVAPDGTTTADKLVEAATTTIHFASQTVAKASSAIQYTFTCFAKQGERTRIFMEVSDLVSDVETVVFDLAGGQIGVAPYANGGVGWASASASISPAANGFYRCRFTATSPATANIALRIGLDNGSGTGAASLTYLGDITKGAYIWGVQLETGSAASGYVATTTAAKTVLGIPAPWDASGPVGYNAEPAATNLALQSQTFGTGWTVGAGAAVAVDQTTAPDGTTTADKITASAGATDHRVYYPNTQASTTYTASVYAKALGTSWLGLSYGSGGFNQAQGDGAFFNLTTGVVGTVSAGFTATITAVGNGWYRCTITGTGGAGGANLVIEPFASDNQVYNYNSASGTESVYVWGFQLETGSVATSPITTTTVAVTRNADVLTYAQTSNILASGSCYAEVFTSDTATLGDRVCVGIKTAGTIPLGIVFTANLFGAEFYDGTNNPIGTKNIAGNAVAKLAASWDAGTSVSRVIQNGVAFSGSYNGNLLVAGTALAVGQNGSGGASLNGNLRNLQIYSQSQSAAYWQGRTT
jgi:hypothetical protein